MESVIHNPAAHNDNKPRVTGHLVLAVLAVVLGSAVPAGYNIAVVNNPQQIITEFINSTYYDRNEEPIAPATLLVIWSVFVSMLAVGAVIGSFAGGYMANGLGRKCTLLLNNIPMALGAALSGSAKVAGSYEMIIVGRLILGFTAGLSASVTPMYLMEISTVRLRGMMGTIHQLGATVGVLVAMVLGLDNILGTEEVWNLLLAFTGVGVVYQLLTLTLCPESPEYLLVNKGDEKAAEKALVWFRKTSNVDDELNELRKQRHEQSQRKSFAILDLIRIPAYRKPFLISIMMHISMQATGISAVMYYSGSIFQRAKLSQEDAQWATLGVGGVLAAMTFVSAMTIDRAGRRVLQLLGFTGMILGTVLLTIGIELQDKAGWLSFVSIGAVLFIVISFAIGPGSVPWLISTELFTEEARFAAVSVCVSVNWLFNAAVGFVFPTFIDSFGSYMFIPFTVFMVLFWLFTFFMLPETKGKTFREISRNFESKKTPPEKSLEEELKNVSTNL